MKIDKHIKDLSKRLDDFSSGTGDNNDEYDDGSGLHKCDDDYYLDMGSEPPRFAYYRRVRAEKWKTLQHKQSEYDHRITQDELDYALKRNLRIPPEERYQHEKAHWYWHDSSWYWREANGYDGYGCNNSQCIPECRFYPGYGRIEDVEVREEYNKVVESYRRRNAVVEPPSESDGGASKNA